MTNREKEVVRAVVRAMREPKNIEAIGIADAFVMLYLPGLIRTGQPYVRREALALLLEKLATTEIG